MLYRCTKSSGPSPYKKSRYYKYPLDDYGDSIISFSLPYRFSCGMSEQNGWRASFEIWHMPLRRIWSTWKNKKETLRCWKIARWKRKMTPIWEKKRKEQEEYAARVMPSVLEFYSREKERRYYPNI